MSWYAFVSTHPVEALEQLSSAIFGDAVTGVADYHFHCAVDGPRLHPNATARNVIFNGVFDQILRDHRNERAIGV
jgi:hypothetical protein